MNRNELRGLARSALFSLRIFAVINIMLVILHVGMDMRFAWACFAGICASCIVEISVPINPTKEQPNQ